MCDVGSLTPRGLAWQLAALFTLGAEMCRGAAAAFSTWVASVEAKLPCHERCVVARRSRPFT